MKIPEKVRKDLEPIVDFAKKLNVKLYIVGGFLRDLFFKKIPKDVDIYVEGLPSTVFTKRLLDNNLIDRKEDFIGPILDNKVLLLSEISINDMEYDFVSVEGCNVFEYIKNSDFTINTLIYDLMENKLYDYTGRGLQDLKNRILYPNSDRLGIMFVLRGIKFNVFYGFNFSPEFISMVKNRNFDTSEIHSGAFYKLLDLLLENEKAKEILKELNLTDLLPDFLREEVI